MDNKIKSFTDLITWQEAHELARAIYALTAKFPQEELYALTSQMRRAAVSTTSNIAEGFARKTPKEKIQFYFIALGSNTELQSQLILAKDVKYIPNETFESLLNQMVKVNKLLNGLIRSIRK